MKTLLFILLFPFIGYSQLDFVILGGGVAYQQFAEKPEMDLVLHTWGAYFLTNASYHFIEKTNWSPMNKKIAPVAITLFLIFAKELYDEKISKNPTPFSIKDVAAGCIGVGASIIKIKLKF